ncbi:MULTISPECIES: helix-turn-helix domain-containing protein [unclassified Lacticaseibacillus]|uniref:helix-turn-helix domain-containing protein n=1 Tax=unclassified Lacticaseibacillus TaxID=2759744 RepID=UPI0019431187|nr:MULTISPECIES: helix-turn-helix domain-containing protein [unclassified Lacticaseibacillus]
MRGREDIFLAQSQAEETSLFRRIVNARSAQTPVAERLVREQAAEPLVTDVNLKQIAALTRRNYGSVYNTYNSLVSTLQEMIGTKTTTVSKLFNVPSSQVRLFLVQKDHPYRFLHTLVYHDYKDFAEFLTASHASKATMLRHLKPLRDFARKFGVRFSYETLSLQGDEKRIRLFLTMIFWLATDGAGWPFDDLKRDAVGEVVDETVALYDMNKPNYVTREVAMYYTAIAHKRSSEGLVIIYDPNKLTLRYPTANLFEELQPGLAEDFLFPQFSTEGQMGESAAMYFVFNFLPLFGTTNSASMAQTLARFQHYNQPIYTLVTEFLAKLPVAFLTTDQIPEGALNMLKANLLANAVSTLEFGEDLSQVIAYEINEHLVAMPENPMLKKKVRQTLEHVVYVGGLDDLKLHLDALTDAFYSDVLQIAQQFAPKSKVRVAAVTEQAGLGYVDLLSFLMAQPFVELVSPDEGLDDVDLVIESATVPDAAKRRSGILTYKWAASASNDWFGELYAELRQIWENKNEGARDEDFDY